MRKHFTQVLTVITVLSSSIIHANDMDDLGLPSDSEGFSLMERESDLDHFRRKLKHIRQWITAIPELRDYTLDKMYDSRVESAAKLLEKISKKVKLHPNKEVSDIGLDVLAEDIRENFKSKPLRKKRSSTSKNVHISDSKIVSYKSYREFDRNNELMLRESQLKRFAGVTGSNKSNVIPRSKMTQNTIFFIAYEKMDLLQRLGYPNIPENLTLIERFCENYNRFLRRDLQFSNTQYFVDRKLIKLADESYAALSYQAEILAKQVKNGALETEVDFKSFVTKLESIHSVVKESKMFNPDIFMKCKFLVQYMNDVLIDDKLIDVIPYINMDLIPTGSEEKINQYTTEILLEKIIETLRSK